MSAIVKEMDVNGKRYSLLDDGAIIIDRGPDRKDFEILTAEEVEVIKTLTSDNNV